MSTPTSRVSCRWIVGRGVDLALIIGGTLAGFLYLGLNLVLGIPISYLWWFWSLGLDGTHIFATASRTYFDRTARRENRSLLFGSLAVFFSLGPVLVLVGLKPLLGILVGVWAYYHIVRQHYGFVMIYKVKNADMGRANNLLDRLLLGVMLTFPPYHRFFIHHPEELGIPGRFSVQVMAPWLEPLLWAAVGGTVLAFVAGQVIRIRAGRAVNAPKLLLYAGLFPLHWLVFAHMSWLAAVPTVTIVHNLQYHAIVWFHNRNKYGTESSLERYGRVPRAVAHSLAAYVILALSFSLLYRVPGYLLGRNLDLAFGLFCGFGFTHYYLDSKIWRVRHDPALKVALQLA